MSGKRKRIKKKAKIFLGDVNVGLQVAAAAQPAEPA